MLCLVFPFKPLKQDEEESVKSALKCYVDTAKIIRSTNYEGSVADKLECIIDGDFDLLKRQVGLKDDDTTYDLSKAFITLAVPSLEGKTQLAFVLEKIRPLYFGFLDYYAHRRDIQPIYLNFEYLNMCIYDSAEEDVKLITENTRPELHDLLHTVPYLKHYRGNNYELLRITPEELKNHQNHLKLSTLGLLVYLVNDAKANYDSLDVSNRPSWLEYPASRKDLYFQAKTIDEIPKQRPLMRYLLISSKDTVSSWMNTAEALM